MPLTVFLPVTSYIIRICRNLCKRFYWLFTLGIVHAFLFALAHNLS